MINDANVAEHSFHVTCIYIWMARRLGHELTVDNLLEVLCHDEGEAVTGDAPSTTKDLKEITGVDPHPYLLKMADMAEFLLTCSEEKLMGNHRLNEAWGHCLYRLNAVGDMYRTNMGRRWFNPWTLFTALKAEINP